MKLLHKLAPIAIVASATAAVVPFATSCSQGWTSFSARDFDEEKYEKQQHEEVTGGWNPAMIWDDFGKSKVAFDMDVRYYTNGIYEQLKTKMEAFPRFDIKYRNFKAELDANNNPYVSYDLEVYGEFDHQFKTKTNAADLRRTKASLSLSMKHVPVAIDCLPMGTTYMWKYNVDFEAGIWTDESNLYYKGEEAKYLIHDNEEYYLQTNSIAFELNTDVGHDRPPVEYFDQLTAMISYYYQNVQPIK